MYLSVAWNIRIITALEAFTILNGIKNKSSIRRFLVRYLQIIKLGSKKEIVLEKLVNESLTSFLNFKTRERNQLTKLRLYIENGIIQEPKWVQGQF